MSEHPNPAVLAVAPLDDLGAEPRLLVGLDDGRIGLVGASATRLLGRLATPVGWVGVGAEGDRWLATDEGGQAIAARLSDGKVEAQLAGPIAMSRLAPLPDGRYLGVDATASIVIWRPSPDGFVSAPLLREGEPVAGEQLAVRADGRVTIRMALRWTLWDPATGAFAPDQEPIDGMQLHQLCGDLGLSRDGQLFYAYWDDLEVFEADDGALVRRAPARQLVTCSSISDDGRLLGAGGPEGWVGVLGEDGAPIFEARPTEGEIVTAVLSRDGKLLAWADRAGAAGLIEVPSGRELLDRHAVAAQLGLPADG